MDTNGNTPEPSDDGPGLALRYLESVKAWMDPEQFATLEKAVHELTHMLSQGQQGTFEAGDRNSFTPEVHREFLKIMAILTTGRMNQYIVQLPGPDGSIGYTAVTADVGNDPNKLAELRAGLHRQSAEHQATDDELGGATRASHADSSH